MIGVARREPEHPLALGGDEDRQRRPSRRRQEDGVVDARPLSAVRDPLTADERHDDPERVLEPAHPVIEGETERVVLGLVPAAAQAQDEPAAGHLVRGRGHLGEQPGIPERGRQDERSELDLVGHRRERAQQRPRLVDAHLATVVLAEEEVVAHPQAVDPARLRLPGDRGDLHPRTATTVLGGLRQDHADLHGRRVYPAATPARRVVPAGPSPGDHPGRPSSMNGSRSGPPRPVNMRCATSHLRPATDLGIHALPGVGMDHHPDTTTPPAGMVGRGRVAEIRWAGRAGA